MPEPRLSRARLPRRVRTPWQPPRARTRLIVPFTNDPLSARGRVALLDRRTTAQEVGRWSNARPGAVVVGPVRASRVPPFYEDEPSPIEAGDLLMLIQSSRQPNEASVAC